MARVSPLYPSPFPNERETYNLDIYRSLLRTFLFQCTDPEWAHQRVMSSLNWLDREAANPITSWVQAYLNRSCSLADPRLQQTIWGLCFANPIGLAAGFDKNGVAAGVWSALGFGFAELGTVTWQAQPGNPQPRLFRLPLDQAVLNRMGFNNQGAAAMAALLAKRQESRHPRIPIGINLGKSKLTPLEQAAIDYRDSFRLLQSWGDYFVVNVSSPNTPGLRLLQAAEQLAPILETLQTENQAQKPLLVKIAPDLDEEAIAQILILAKTYQLAGIIATNTTISREGLNTQILSQTGNLLTEEAGGISGAPLRQRSTEVIRFIWQQTQGQLPIIGVGGIFTAEDAWEKITAGASLLQVYTGWIYEGPWMIKRILAGVLDKLQEHRLNSLADAVGWGHRHHSSS